MFVTGPDVVKTVAHEDVTQEELGAPQRTRPNPVYPIWHSKPTSMHWNSCVGLWIFPPAISNIHLLFQPMIPQTGRSIP